MLSQEYIETLKKLAKKKTWYEQSEEDGKDYMDVQDFCGGNFDDAYAGGERDGKIEMAREVLDALAIEY